MTWSFETSLAAFLAISFASQAAATATRQRLSLQFCLGVLCIAGFATGLLPADIAEKSRMRDLGFIAFNVLMVHSGTLLDFGFIRRNRKGALIGLSAVLASLAASFLCVMPLAGRQVAAATAGPLLGGGGAAAIAANALMGTMPRMSAWPWLLFMLQGFFGVPLFMYAASRAKSEEPYIGQKPGHSPAKDAVSSSSRMPGPLYERIPQRYKTTAYYLGLLMAAAVLNRWLYASFLSWTGVGSTTTALLLGTVLNELGLLDRDPLGSSGAMGFLMLGLMSLMALVLARTPLMSIISMLPVALAAFFSFTALLAATGAVLGRMSGIGAWAGIAIAAGCMVGNPFVGMMFRESKSKAGQAFLNDAIAAASLANGAASIILAGLAALFI